ncbi:DUF2069 domain-containing protein [Abyssibacter profundi]|nr:DUF2069 domain-containing protein [Abyssibacter profundi]
MRRWSPAARALTLTGWLTTLVSLPLWLGWQSSMPHGWWIAGVLSLPLLAAGPGLWRAKLYTHGWCSLLSLAYMALGLMEVFATSVGRTPAMVHLLAAVALFMGCVLYPRLHNREQAAHAIHRDQTRPAAREPAES